MTILTSYDKASGRVIGTGDLPDSMIPLQENETTGIVLETLDYETQYVPSGVVTPRPALTVAQNKTQITANGLDEWIVTGVPVGALVTWPDGVVTTVDDGEIVFTVDVVGTYNFTVNAFPYLVEEVSVEAVT